MFFLTTFILAATGSYKSSSLSSIFHWRICLFFFPRAESFGHSSSLMYAFISPSKPNVLFQCSPFTFCVVGDDDEIHVLCQSQWERKNLIHLGQGPVCCDVIQFPKTPWYEGKLRQPRVSALQWAKPLSQSRQGMSWANLTSPAWQNKPGYCQQLSLEVLQWEILLLPLLLFPSLIHLQKEPHFVMQGADI